MRLKVLLHAEEEGGFSASVLAMPGCYSQGETREEALNNIREAAELWLEVANERYPHTQNRHASRHHERCWTN